MPARRLSFPAKPNLKFNAGTSQPNQNQQTRFAIIKEFDEGLYFLKNATCSTDQS